MDSDRVSNILAQNSPAPITEVDLYTVKDTETARVYGFVVTNQVAGARSFRIAFAPGGAVAAPSQYAYYDTPLSANETLLIQFDVTLKPKDVVRVYAAAGGVNFQLLGQAT